MTTEGDRVSLGFNHDFSVTPEQEERDAMDYIRRLQELLPRYARRAQALAPAETGSVEWSEALGEYWTEVRQSVKASRYSAAAKSGAHVNDIRLLEGGLVEIEQVGDFLERYSQALTGSTALWEKCRERFNFPRDAEGPKPV